MFDTDTIVAVVLVICYIIDSVFLAKIAEKTKKGSPLLAWVPIGKFFLTRQIAGRKSRWQWLILFLCFALWGNPVASKIGEILLVWGYFIWYWAAFCNIMEERTDLSGLWFIGAICFVPLKLYIMYKAAQ